MLLALETFPVALKAVIAGFEESTDGIGGDRVALGSELNCQLGGAFAGPSKWPHRIATGIGFHEFFEGSGELRVLIFEAFPATARTALSVFRRRRVCRHRRSELGDPRPNGGWHKSGRTSHSTGSAITKLDRLRSCPKPPRLFAKRMLEAGVTVTDGFACLRFHAQTLQNNQEKLSTLFCGEFLARKNFRSFDKGEVSENFFKYSPHDAATSCRLIVNPLDPSGGVPSVRHMIMNHWMSWEGGVDLIAKTSADLEMPNAIVHVARMVHTPVGSAPSGMIFWQPDPAAAPLAFGFVSSDAAVGAYFANHIFANTPFEGAPVILGAVVIDISEERATARVEIPGFVFESHLAEFLETTMIHRAPIASAPFYQQGLEATAKHACLKVNGEKIDLVVPAISITGGPGAVVAACGLYAR